METFKNLDEDSVIYQDYHMNGNIRIKGLFVNGKKEGEWIYKSPINEIIYSGTYHENKLVNGIDIPIKYKEEYQCDAFWKRKNEKGQLTSCGGFLRGMNHGWHFAFWENGQIKTADLWNEGNLISTKIFNEDGSKFDYNI